MFNVVEVKGVKVSVTMNVCHYVYLVDCSYSMSGDLKTIREHLKTIMSTLVKHDDRLSVIYFAGKGQVGTVFENVQINEHTVSLQNSVIDSNLKPIGMTCFKDAIEYAIGVSERDTSGIAKSLVMLTDGYDNQSGKNAIREVTEAATNHFESIAFLEYGWYADRDLLAELAKSVGGVHVFSEGHTQYNKAIATSFNATPREKLVEIPVGKTGGDIVYIHNNAIKISPIKNGVVKVPETLQRFYQVIPEERVTKNTSEDHLYLMLYYAATVGNDEMCWDILKHLGDVSLIDKYSNAFTKQELTNFKDSVESCVFNKDARLADGIDHNKVPSKDCVTVIDVIEKLSLGGAELITDSPYFSYNRIGRKKGEDTELPRFTKSPKSAFSMTNITYNQSRPNVSVQVTVEGTVEVPENEFGLQHVPSKIVRNYAIIRDGILNMKALPVVINSNIVEWLDEHGVKYTLVNKNGDENYVIIHLETLPVINRASVENINLDDFKMLVKKQQELQAVLKAANHKMTELHGADRGKSEGLKDNYGEDAAKWLSSIGVRDYGFSPKVKTQESEDTYVSIEVNTKIKGLSSLPSFNAVDKKIEGGKKLNIADKTLQKGADVVKVLMEIHSDDIYTVVASTKSALRSVNVKLAKCVYALVLGRKWFEGQDEPFEIPIDIFEEATTMTVSKDRKEIKI